KAGRVVDDGAAAETAAGNQGDRAVGGGGVSPLEVQLAHHGKLELIEVGLVVVAALLQYDDVLPGRRQLARYDTATSTGSDHDRVAGQRRVTLETGRPDSFWSRGRGRHPPRVADLGPDRIGAVILGITDEGEQG